jgi:hypothetical protein
MNKDYERRNKAIIPPPQEDEAELPVVLEWWDPPGGSPKVIARLESLAVAEAAFEAALAEQPDRTLVLRQGLRVLRSNR